MEPIESKSSRQEIPKLGAITGIRGISELWSYFETLLSPLGFKRKSTGLSTAVFAGEVAKRQLSFKLSHRKQSKYFGTADHMSRVRTFQGLDVEVTLPTKVLTRASIGTRAGGEGLIRRILLGLSQRTGAQQFVHDHPLLRPVDILTHDTIWMERFLADPMAMDLLQELMGDAPLLVSWSVKLTPGKMVVNRRFSSLAQTSTESIGNQLEQIVLLAGVAESKPVGQEISLTKMERLQKESPKKAIALSGLYLLFLIITGTALFLIPFFLILWLR